MQDQNREKADEVAELEDLFKRNWGVVFGEAQKTCDRQRHDHLVRPKDLPKETDVEQLKQYTEQRIRELTEDQYDVPTESKFVELRNLLVSRLTLFNARRGGEPARLTLSEWSDAQKGTWFDDQVTTNCKLKHIPEFKSKYSDVQ